MIHVVIVLLNGSWHLFRSQRHDDWDRGKVWCLWLDL